MRVVVDTNVVISGAMGKGETVNKLFDVLFDQHQLFSSNELIKEAKEKLESVRLKKFIDPVYKKGFVDKFLLHATILKPEVEVRACRDADDDKVLSLALAAEADCINFRRPGTCWFYTHLELIASCHHPLFWRRRIGDCCFKLS